MHNFMIIVQFIDGFQCPCTAINCVETVLYLSAPNMVTAQRICKSMFSIGVYKYDICCVDDVYKIEFPEWVNRKCYGYNV